MSLSKRFEEAEQEFEEAMRLDPNLFEAPYWYAQAQLSQGKYEAAVKLGERAISLRPEDYQSLGFMGIALKSLNRHAEAQSYYRRQSKLIVDHLEQHPDDARACIMGASSSANIGDSERSAYYAARAMAVDPEDPMVLYNVACAFGILGKTPECLDALEQAVSKGWGDKAWLEHDSDFDSIRSEPRYLELVQAM